MTAHDAFEEALAAYALDALAEPERQAFERHLATCDACQGMLADLRQVTGSLGDLVEPLPLPPDLKARTIARRLGQVQAVRTQGNASIHPTAGYGWLAFAAAAVVAVGIGIYAWSLRSRVLSLEALVAQASTQIETLRTELIELRRDSGTLLRTVNILGSPDVVRIPLEGQAGAASAGGTAHWSATAGLVVSADGLPALTPDRVYQLWIIRPDGSGPVSAGFLALNPSGTATFASTSAGVLTRPATLAVTVEPAGGSPGPTTPVVLVGGA